MTNPILCPRYRSKEIRARVAEQRSEAATKQKPGLVERTLAAFNEGLPDTLGAPVDLVNQGMALVGVPIGNEPFGGSNNIRKLMHGIGIGQLDESYRAQSPGQAYAQEALRFIGGLAIPGGGLRRAESLLAKGGSKLATSGTTKSIEKYIRQGFTPEEANYLASRYKGRGHHFVPEKREVTLIEGFPTLKGLPAKISES